MITFFLKKIYIYKRNGGMGVAEWDLQDALNREKGGEDNELKCDMIVFVRTSVQLILSPLQWNLHSL